VASAAAGPATAAEEDILGADMEEGERADMRTAAEIRGTAAGDRTAGIKAP
jgi:hypothetical protein